MERPARLLKDYNAAVRPDQRPSQWRLHERRRLKLLCVRHTKRRASSICSHRKMSKKPDTIDHAREETVHVDETAVIAHLYRPRRADGRIMVDVGAHFGGAARHFHAMGWSIYCFEPDAENREKLTARFAGERGIVIDPRAVSDRAEARAQLFRSPQSTGISSLSAFHGTHQLGGLVDVTTLAEIVRDFALKKIDFLKIDVEGHDFAVLKGAPWDAIRPDVIECEFEDSKTASLGHSWRDIADFLRQKGYAVYVSEWFPIIRYGVRHDWRRLFAYSDDTDVADGAWGNLLAFADDPGEELLRKAFAATLVRGEGPKANNAAKDVNTETPRSESSMHAGRPFYAPAGDWLRRHAPVIYVVAKSMRLLLKAIWKRRAIVALVALPVAALGFAGLAAPSGEMRSGYWGAALAFGLIAVIAGLGGWAYARIRDLTAETASLRAARREAQGRLASLGDRIDALENSRRELRADGENISKDFAVKVDKIERDQLELAALIETQTGRIDELHDIIAEIDDEMNARNQTFDAAANGKPGD